MASDTIQAHPNCAHCQQPMQLAAMESNPTSLFAPPLAHFECDCGATMILAWRRRAYTFRGGVGPQMDAGLPLAA